MSENLIQTSLKQVEESAKKHRVLIPYYNGKEVTTEVMEVLFYDQVHQVWNPNSQNKAIMDSLTLDQIESENVRDKLQVIVKGFEIEIKTYVKNFLNLISQKYTNLVDSDEKITKISKEIALCGKEAIYGCDSETRYIPDIESRMDAVKNNIKYIFSEDTYHYNPFLSIEARKDLDHPIDPALSKPFNMLSYFTEDLSIVSDFAIMHGQYVASVIIGALNFRVFDKELKNIMKGYINNYLSEVVDGLNSIYSKAYIIAQQYKSYAEYKAIVDYYDEREKEMEQMRKEAEEKKDKDK